jgi:aminopeptidase N
MAPTDNNKPEAAKRTSIRRSIKNLLRSSKRASGSAVAETKQVQPVVLPKYVTPTKYNLSITPNLSGDFKYKGSVDVSITLSKSGVKDIALHAFELELHTATYVDDAGVHEASDFVYDAKLSTVTCKFDSVLAEGQGILRISFTGVHNNQMAGFYRSGYTDSKGERQIMLSTQFEALSARRCFPCVDEPAVKAIFETSLVVDAKLTVLGNMPESSSEYIANGKMKKVTFQTTPIMSTYLLAFCVGEFDYVSTTTEHGVLVRVYTPPTKRHLGYFALDAGKRCLDLFDDAFGTPYPLPKLDMIAIGEFSMGG